jgi:hypothetical protein
MPHELGFKSEELSVGFLGGKWPGEVESERCSCLAEAM